MEYGRLWEISKSAMLPGDHINYLNKLKYEYNFTPSVVFDIGACVMHWSKPVRIIWPEAKFFLFEAMEQVKEIYENSGFNNFYLGVLSDTDNKEIDFFQNIDYPGGNSYYRENSEFCSLAEHYFDDNHKFKRKTITLDSVVREKNYPLPDLIKIDVQGCEVDILKGATECLKNVKHLIVELQHVEYNKGAWQTDKSIPFIESLGFKLESSLFSQAIHDGDYHFMRK